MTEELAFKKEKKRSHDVAYFIALLVILVATFLLLPAFINGLLGGIPIPKP